MSYRRRPKPLMHQAKEDPQKWNAHWESILSTEKDCVWPPELCLRNLACLQYEEGDDNDFDFAVENYRSILSVVCGQRYNMALRRANYVDRDFDSKWRAATKRKREEVSLKAFVEACSYSKNVHEMRMTTPEVMLSRFSEPNFVPDLLQRVSADDLVSIPTEPVYVDQGNAWTKFRKEVYASNVSKYRKLAVDFAMVYRTQLLYNCLLYTFDIFLNLPVVPPVLVKVKDGYTKSERKERFANSLKNAQRVYGPELGRKLALKAEDERRKRVAGQQRMCAAPGCLFRETEEVPLRRCAKCFDSIRREVFYCSRECQILDWKKGWHKQRCGVAADESTIPMNLPGHVMAGEHVIPPAAANYKRTPALLAHILYLSINPGTHIAVRESMDEAAPWYIFRFPDNIGKRVVVARDLAMTTGNPEVVVNLCHFVIWYFCIMRFDVSPGWNFDNIMQCMSKEFDIPDLKNKILECQEKQWADEHRRPPLFSTMSPDEWENCLVKEYDLDRRLV